MRKDQRKDGESFLDHSFNNKLKSQAQWDKFVEYLDSTLAMIIGNQGGPLPYVIRENEESHFDPNISFVKTIIHAAALSGPKFDIDAKSVHQLILYNVHVKPLLWKRNGRLDMNSLSERYSSNATKQGIINAAKSTLKNLRCKNKSSFSFERFSSRIQKAYHDL